MNKFITISLAVLFGLLATVVVAGEPTEAETLSKKTATAEKACEKCALQPGASSLVRTEMESKLPALTLTNQLGKRIALASEAERDGPMLVQFIFTTCPTICPVLVATFAGLEKETSKAGGDSPRLYSVTLDPEHDNPERLRKFANKWKASKRWQFLTGERDEIEAVQKAFESFERNKTEHKPLVFIRRDKASPWVRIQGFPSVQDLVAELGERETGKPSE